MLWRAAIDAVVLAGAWMIAYVLRHDLPLPAWAQYQLLFGVPVAVLVQFAVLRAMGTGREAWRHTSFTELIRLTQAIVLAGALLYAVRLLVPALTDTFPRAAYLSLQRSTMVIQAMAALIGLAGVRGLRRMHVQYLETGRAFVAGNRRVLLVGAGRMGVRLAREYLERPDLRVQVIGFIDDDLGLQGMLVAGIPVLGRIEDLPAVVGDRHPDEVVVTLTEPAPATMHRVVALCEETGVHAHVPPAFAAEPTGLTGPIELTEVHEAAPPVDLPTNRTTRDLVRDSGKRAFDVTVGTVLAAVATPAIVVLATFQAISLRTTRPFFVQDRIGQYGRLFRFPKIRTLPPNAPKYADKRAIEEVSIPWLSQKMRDLHLDELPQLYLVLTGEMSLVGPRPEMAFLHDQMHAGFATARTTVRPGLTGLWQISEAWSDLILETPDYDLFYLRHRSWWMDLWILWHTALQMLGIGTPVTLDQLPKRYRDAAASMPRTVRTPVEEDDRLGQVTSR